MPPKVFAVEHHHPEKIRTRLTSIKKARNPTPLPDLAVSERKNKALAQKGTFCYNIGKSNNRDTFTSTEIRNVVTIHLVGA
jgi:hypothetical protein